MLLVFTFSCQKEADKTFSTSLMEILTAGMLNMTVK